MCSAPESFWYAVPQVSSELQYVSHQSWQNVLEKAFFWSSTGIFEHLDLSQRMLYKQENHFFWLGQSVCIVHVPTDFI